MRQSITGDSIAAWESLFKGEPLCLGMVYFHDNELSFNKAMENWIDDVFFNPVITMLFRVEEGLKNMEIKESKEDGATIARVELYPLGFKNALHDIRRTDSRQLQDSDPTAETLWKGNRKRIH